MKQQFTNLEATYEREIASKAENKAKFYVILAFLAVIIYVIMGIRPLAVTTAANRKVLVELKDIRANLQQKTTRMRQEEVKINELGEQLDVLYTRLPEQPSIENYLESIVFAAGKSGFSVLKLQRQTQTNNAIDIEIDVTGNISFLPQLIEDIENSARFTKVKEIRTETNEGITNVKLLVQVFVL